MQQDMWGRMMHKTGKTRFPRMKIGEGQSREDKAVGHAVRGTCQNIPTSTALLPSNSIIKLVHIISFISNIKVQIQTISEISEKGTKGTKGLIGLNLPHTEDNTE